MNFGETVLRYRLVVLVLTAASLIAGLSAYQSLGRLEDPSFPIKQAVVTTTYPGASAQQVADEVTDVMEAALQRLDQVDYITSESRAGVSIIKVFIKQHFSGDDLPQIWDELRRRVGDGAAKLPPGAGEPMVNDQFGDVYGLLYYVYGDGFTLPELYDHARMLRDELSRVKDVSRVSLLGEPREVIYIEIPQERKRLLGNALASLLSSLEGRGRIVPAGEIDVGDLRLRVEPQGRLDAVQTVENLFLTSRAGAQVRLGDIARVTRDVREPPSVMLRYNDHPAIAVGVSTVAGGNVVNVGDAIRNRLAELQAQTPIGIELGVVSMQGDSVRLAVSGFTWGLIQSVAIVIGVLLIAMGLRSGLLIGGILALTIAGTFVVMEGMAVDLQRVSLGALIIALGMLVDNAIVVVEGISSAAQRGISRTEAAKAVIRQSMWPLLGATIIAVLAFAPIGLSPDSTGDYCGSLFTVIWVSLLLSWLFALTSTPVLAVWVLQAGQPGDADPYAGRVFRMFRTFLEWVLARRAVALGLILFLLAGSVLGFGNVKQAFFPASARPQFLVDLWMAEGTRVEVVDQRMRSLQEWLAGQEGVTAVATSAGSGTLRFELTYSPQSPNPAYGQMIVSVDHASRIDRLMDQVRTKIDQSWTDVQGWPWRMMLGPGGEAKIQVRFSGPNPDVLRQLASQAETLMAAHPYATGIRTDWRQRTHVIAPVMEDNRAAQLGLTPAEVSQATRTAFEGETVGTIREGDITVPVMLRAPLFERDDVARLKDVAVVGPRGGRAIPLDHLTEQITTVSQDPIVARRDRIPTITVMCDPVLGPASALFQSLRPPIERIVLPVGYTMEWGGEYEKSGKANEGLSVLMPYAFSAMILILLLLFNNVRQPLIILLTIPLAMIGVTFGLLVTGSEFGFMAILGVLSLTGMLVKNAIVLIDEANALVASGRNHYDAIVQSAVSRARPVSMAAATTVLGMIPLLNDIFFRDMAVVIMFGLTFATVLTLVVVPLLYAVLYQARPEPTDDDRAGESA